MMKVCFFPSANGGFLDAKSVDAKRLMTSVGWSDGKATVRSGSYTPRLTNSNEDNSH